MSQSPKQTCHEDLKRRILSLEIAPGSDLEEAVLTQHYGISRTPLREVLQRLAGEGFVTVAENARAKVASMDLAAMRVFFQTAPLIYASVARLAAENRTATQLEVLRVTQALFAKAVASGDAAAMALRNHRFHEVIGEMAHNAYLMASLKRLLIDHTRLAQMFYRPAAPAESLAIRQASQQHEAMIEALEAQDAAALAELTLQHWDLSRDRMERFVRPDPLPLEIGG